MGRAAGKAYLNHRCFPRHQQATYSRCLENTHESSRAKISIVKKHKKKNTKKSKMNRFCLLVAVAFAVVASNSVFCLYASQQGADSLPQQSGDYQLQGVNSNGDSESASATAQSGGADSASYSKAGPSTYGSNQNIPYSTGNTRGNTVTTSITYPQNRGEILIHRPAAIIVKRPPTRVLVNHPPLVVKPAPVVLHKPPAVVLRKVFIKNHPRPVRVEPVYVNVVKPPAEKYFVNERQQQIAGAQLAGVPAGYGVVNGGASSSANAGGANGASASSGQQNLQDLSAYGLNQGNSDGGYTLVQGSPGLATLAGITGQGDYAPNGNFAPSGNNYAGNQFSGAAY